MKTKEKLALKDLDSWILGIREELAEKILAFPRNPAAMRLGSNCFTINRSDLGKSWDVFYHDWKAQAIYLVALVSTTPIEDVAEILRSIAKKGGYTCGFQHFRFSTEICKCLHAILDELEVAK